MGEDRRLENAWAPMGGHIGECASAYVRLVRGYLISFLSGTCLSEHM